MFQQFLIIASAHFLALLSPGQDFVLLLRTSLRFGILGGVKASAGIALANAMWISLAILAVALISDYPMIMRLLRYLGALVLIYMGWCFLKSRPLKKEISDDSMSGSQKARGGRFFLSGFVSGASNPKNGVFYAGLFSAGIPDGTPLSWKVLYGIWMSSVVFLWDAAISASIGAERTRRLFARFQWRVEQAAGALLMLIGVLMFFF